MEWEAFFTSAAFLLVQNRFVQLSYDWFEVDLNKNKIWFLFVSFKWISPIAAPAKVRVQSLHVFLWTNIYSLLIIVQKDNEIVLVEFEFNFFFFKWVAIPGEEQ